MWLDTLDGTGTQMIAKLPELEYEQGWLHEAWFN
jgi:hypothetical protein